MCGLCTTAFSQVPVMVLEVENEEGKLQKIEIPLDDELDLITFGRNNNEGCDLAKLTSHYYYPSSQCYYFEMDCDKDWMNSGGRIVMLLGKVPDMDFENHKHMLRYYPAGKYNGNIVAAALQYNNGVFVPSRVANGCDYVANTEVSYFAYLDPGDTVYCRPFFLMDGMEPIASAPVRVVLPNTLEGAAEKVACAGGVHKYDDDNFWLAVDFDMDEVKDVIANVLGEGEAVYNAMGSQFISANINLVAEQIRRERCVDGTFAQYKMTSAEVRQLLQYIQEKSKHVSISTLESVNYELTSRGTQAFTKNYDTVEYVNTDEAWEVPGNRYIRIIPSNTTTNPSLAFDLNHVLIPGKTYNITMRFAPDTDAENEDEAKGNRFYTYLYECNPTAPFDIKTSGIRINNPDGVSGAYFETKANEVTEFTFSFTPQTASPRMVIQFQSQVTSSKQAQFSRQIRVVDVNVDEVEE